MMRCVEGFVVQTYPHPDWLDSFCNLMGRSGAHWTTSISAEPGKLYHEAEKKNLPSITSSMQHMS